MRKLSLIVALFFLGAACVFVRVHGQSGPEYFTYYTYANYSTNALLRPSAVYISPFNSRHLFIADSGHNQIDDFSGGLLQVLGGTGAKGYQDGSLQAATFNGPTGMGGIGYVARGGNFQDPTPTISIDLVVVDTLNNAIRHLCVVERINSLGTPPTCFPSGVTTESGGQSGRNDGSGANAQYNYPGAFGTSSSLQGPLLADVGNNSVRSMDSTA